MPCADDSLTCSKRSAACNHDSFNESTVRESACAADLSPAQAKPTDISGAVFDGQALDYAGVMKLEKMPTKLELIATVARLIKQVRPEPEDTSRAPYADSGTHVQARHLHARGSQALLVPTPQMLGSEINRQQCDCVKLMHSTWVGAGADEGGGGHQAGAHEGGVRRQGAGRRGEREPRWAGRRCVPQGHIDVFSERVSAWFEM